MKKISKRHKIKQCITVIVPCIVFVAILILVFLAMLGAIGPSGRYYRGDYPELYTVAINSILGSRGFRQYSRPAQVMLEVIDADDYGRVMFFYTEVYWHNLSRDNISAYNLIISQKSDGEYVYFYPYFNFISVDHMIFLSRPRSMPDFSLLVDVFTEEAIAELKEINSWNQELNLDNAIRVPIVRTKEDRDGPIDIETLLSTYAELSQHATRWRGLATFFIEDAYGRSIYTLQKSRVFVVMFHPDGSFDRTTGVMELHDLQNYQYELKIFKEQNNWNQPFNV